MRALVCVKRVPLTGGRILLSDDALSLDTRHLGFTISPHEECGVEEAVRLVEVNGGETVALCLGPPEAVEQLRETMALGIDRSIHLVSDDFRFEPEVTAKVLKIPGVRLYEVPISYYGRTVAEGKKITWRDGLLAVGALARFRLRD